MTVVRIRVQLTEDETVIHEFTRSTTNASGEGVQKLCTAAGGWLQAYGVQVSDAQWEADVARVISARLLADEIT